MSKSYLTSDKKFAPDASQLHPKIIINVFQTESKFISLKTES